MSLSDLKRSRRIREIPVDKVQISNLIALSERDLEASKAMTLKNPDWGFIIAYNSMLQISRALMFSYGFTSSEEEAHKTAVEFARAVLGEEHASMTSLLDRMRRKRHDVTYDEAGRISGMEAGEALKNAESYFRIVRKKIDARLR